MIVGSTKENLSLEKRVAITPEAAKNLIGLGLKIYIEKNYSTHIGIEDNEFKKLGVEIKNSSIDILNTCNLLLKVNCPSDDEIKNIKDNTILIGMMNPSNNQKNISDMLKKKIKIFSSLISSFLRMYLIEENFTIFSTIC